MHFNICDVFYSQCSHKRVSAGNPPAFRARLLAAAVGENIVNKTHHKY